MDDKLESPGPGVPPLKRGPISRPPVALAVLSLVWLAVIGSQLSERLSTTVDEPTHLSAGLAGWRNGDYRQSTGNLFFSQKWTAWPLYRKGIGPPGEGLQRELGWDPVPIGEALVFLGSADPRIILAPSRQMTLWLCLFTGILVWAWAARLGGFWAGGLAAVLYATSPVVLANGVLVTTDTAAAFWYVAALMAYAWMLRRPSAVPGLVTGFCAGMMLLTKFSAAAWIAGAALLLAWHLWRHREGRRILRMAAVHAGACLVAWVTIWSFFGWRFRPGGHAYLPPEASVALEPIVAFLDRWRVLPEPYLRDLETFRGMIAPRPAYLFGHFRTGGYWYFFPVAFLVKSTVAMLLALASCAFLRRAGRTEPDLSLAPLAAGGAGFLLVAFESPLNIGVRHVLPLFALASIAGGTALVRLAQRGMAAQIGVLAVAVLAALEGYSSRSRPLAWFNGLVGGPMAGHRILVDSSLDWGGDLPDLIAWEDRLRTVDPKTPIFVSLLGPVGHEHFGLAATNMDWAFENGQIRPGYFVFSATRLAGGPSAFYGRWDPQLDDEWKAQGLPTGLQPLPHRQAELAVARLAASCRRLTPTERIGPVYFVFRLDREALGRALAGAP